MDETFRERLRAMLVFAENEAEQRLDESRRHENPGITERRVEVLKESRSVIDELDSYALMHKSHISVDQAMSETAYGWLTRAQVYVQAGDVTPMVEVVQSRMGEGFVLNRHREHTMAKLCDYLEKPKPEGP